MQDSSGAQHPVKTFVSVGECMVEMSETGGGGYRLGFAGDTLNTAYYARAALPENWKVDYCTALGDDHYSAKMLNMFDTHSIGSSRVSIIGGKRPGLYLIRQEDGDRHFTYWRENAAARQLADDPARLAQSLEGADLIYFSGITLAILPEQARETLFNAIEKVRKSGALIAFDTNIRPILWPSEDALKSAFRRAAALTDFLLPTHADEIPCFGDKSPRQTAERYAGWGAKEVVVKNGEKDAFVLTHEHHWDVPSVPSVSLVDATAAGDSFNGTYLAHRLAGAAPDAAARLAHKIASIVIGHRGALVDRALLG